MATNTTYYPAGIIARLAHWLGRTWARTWHKADGALASTGLPPKAVTALTWVAKLAIIAAALYVAFWVVMLVVFVIFVMNMGAHRGQGYTEESVYTVTEEEVPAYEMRSGSEGNGVYDHLGFRVDNKNEIW